MKVIHIDDVEKVEATSELFSGGKMEARFLATILVEM